MDTVKDILVFIGWGLVWLCFFGFFAMFIYMVVVELIRTRFMPVEEELEVEEYEEIESVQADPPNQEVWVFDENEFRMKAAPRSEEIEIVNIS